MHGPLSPLNKESHNHNQEVKLPSRKEKESLLKRYAKKLGLNDRVCYLAVGLAIIAFFFLVIIISMAACWPSKFPIKIQIVWVYISVAELWIVGRSL